MRKVLQEFSKAIQYYLDVILLIIMKLFYLEIIINYVKSQYVFQFIHQ